MSGSAAAVPSTVNAGSQVNMMVHLVAPSKAGSYTGYWRMQTDQGTGFGGSVYVQITVSGTAGPTSTSGPTLSPDDLTGTASAIPTAGDTVTISGETGAVSVTITWAGTKVATAPRSSVARGALSFRLTGMER